MDLLSSYFLLKKESRQRKFHKVSEATILLLPLSAPFLLNILGKQNFFLSNHFSDDYTRNSFYLLFLKRKSKQELRNQFLLTLFMLALPIFPVRLQTSIFGRSELNFRVRNGNGWTLALISTNLLSFEKESKQRKLQKFILEITQKLTFLSLPSFSTTSLDSIVKP